MRARARWVFDGLDGATVASRWPSSRARLTLAGAFGFLRHALSRRWPSTAEVRTLFPFLSRGHARSCAARVAVAAARDRWLVATLRRDGIAALRPLVLTTERFATVSPPAILVTFHIGPWNALGPALERLRGPLLLLRRDVLYSPSAGVEIASTGGGSQERALVFRRAVAKLENDGFVATAPDEGEAFGAPIVVSCLDRKLALARGPFALARRSGAALLPIFAVWEGGRIVVDAADAIPIPSVDPVAEPARFERALAAGAVRWLESYLTEKPHEIGLGMLRALATSTERC